MAIQKRNSNGTIKSDYGDTINRRYCPGCDKLYPFSHFYKDARGINGLTRRCKDCHSSKSYVSRRKRPNLVSERYVSRRKWILLKKYNLTLEEFEILLNKQMRSCKICGKNTEDWWTNKTNGGLHIDHHHECGRVRGLLCSGCNTAIGLMSEDPEILKKAIKYLKKSTCCEVIPIEG
ncbi:MAG: endonuclease VII domain-containing protein [Nitrosomonas sp.]|nr:endonuclease VII domain-containing protein [Nitrosomonas sp.]